MARILIIENDQFLLATLVNYFSVEHEVGEATSIAKAKKLINSNDYDLIITDRILNDGDILPDIKTITQSNINRKIIILSKKGELADKVSGLKSGVDDYLAKPFSLQELNVKVNNLLSYKKVANEDVFSYQQLRINLSKFEIKADGEKIDLSQTEVRLLGLLIKNKDRMISRSRISNYVWGDRNVVPCHRTIDVYMLRLRRKLRKYSSLIKTKHGFGYIFSLDLGQKY